MHFTEIKSLKRVHKVNEGIGTDNDINDTLGIVNPYTGEIMTVGDAIASRILDVRTGKIVASPDGTQVSIEEAEKRGLIETNIVQRLYGPCGIKENGRDLTLLEAIQRELYEAESSLLDPSEKKMKVTCPENDQDEGKVVYTVQTEVKLETGPVSLYDAINQDLIDERRGWILDRNSGYKYQVDTAINTKVLDGEVREIVDTKNDTKITVLSAIEKGIINPKLGRYILGPEKLTFAEAKRRLLIVKPMTLKDVCDLNLLTSDGKIMSPTQQTKLVIWEAISRGVLDTNKIKSVLNNKTGQLITLENAIKEGIILPNSTFKDPVSGEIFSIPEAVSRGFIISITQKSIFNIDGFQPPDKSGYISFNAAMAKGFISKKNNGSLLINTVSGQLIPLAEGVKSGEVKPDVYEKLNRKIGIFENGKELTVLEAVFRGYINPKSGDLIDVVNKEIVPLNTAIAKNLITPEGAALLTSLLMINVRTQTTSKIVQRYVTITTTNAQIPENKLSYTEALARGLIDNDNQTFKDPLTKEIIPIVQALTEGKLAPDTESRKKSEEQKSVIEFHVTNEEVDRQTETKKGVKVKEIKRGETGEQIKTEESKTKETRMKEPKTKTTIKVIQLKSEPMEVDRKIATTVTTTHKIHTVTPFIQAPSSSSDQKKDLKTETNEFLTGERQSATEKKVFELPSEGWNLSDSIKQKLFDPITGLFTIPGTDRLVSFEECIGLKLINPESAHVLDPSNKRKISLIRSLEKKILDGVGRYYDDNGRITMDEAIKRELILFEEPMEVEHRSQRLLQVKKNIYYAFLILSKTFLVVFFFKLNKNF